MSLAANLGSMFIVIDVTALAYTFAQVIKMRHTGPWETDLIVIVQRRQWAKPVCLISFWLCFENDMKS